MAKQVCDLRAGKGITVAQSNEHLRVGQQNAYMKKVSGTQDPTREHLNFEIGRGGVVKEVDKDTSIPTRIREILKARGITDPNAGLSEDDPRRRRTVANIILEGSRDVMRQLAFGNQEVNFKRGSDNSQVTRCPGIEKWAQDMYHFMADKYGEDNIAAFVVHLDETLPHIHCTLLPITEKNKFSYNKFFGGNKEDGSRKFKELHDQLAEVNAKYGLERGDSIATTNAKHKSYMQWLEEQIDSGKVTLNEQEQKMTEQSTQITANQGRLDNLETEIKRAEKRYKGLTTMIINLREQKQIIITEIGGLEEEYKNGHIPIDELEEKKQKLENQLNDIQTKLDDKKTKLDAAMTQLEKLTGMKENLEKAYDSLYEQVEKNSPTLEDAAMREMTTMMWSEAIEEVQKEHQRLCDFSKKLPPGLRNEFEGLIDGSFIEDIAERGNAIVAAATAIFTGLIDGATKYAQDHGGSGNGPGSGWRRKEDEDEYAYRRRCCIMGRMMMRPAGRKLKR